MQDMQHEKVIVDIEILNNIDEISESGYYSIFIRHGDRNKIPEGEFGNEVELNDKGFQRSIEYGRDLAHLKINKIFTSPIKRCVQTAGSIRCGIGKDIPIELTKLLGDPGAFVYNDKLAGEAFLRMGFNNCYESLLNYIPVEGSRDIRSGAELLNYFFIKESQKQGVNIFVSHDMIIALYAYVTFGKKYTLGENWVKYLGGLILRKTQNI